MLNGGSLKMATPTFAEKTANQMFFAILGGYLKRSMGSHPELLRRYKIFYEM